MRLWLFFAGLSGASAVVLGAYGAHGFSGSSAARTVFDTALRWQFWHLPGLIAVGLLAARAHDRLTGWILTVAGTAFAAGTVLFCGALYLHALTGTAPLPMAAPAGGFCFIAGWLALAVSALPHPARR